MGDIFFCQFPGDPEEGRTATPLQGVGSDRPPSSLPSGELGLRQIPLHLQHPTVELEYVVPAGGPISLRIYDRMGRQVATLVDGQRQAGLYTERWDGDALPNGVYVAVLDAGTGRVLRKIVLLR
jgi:hypothetical protein